MVGDGEDERRQLSLVEVPPGFVQGVVGHRISPVAETGHRFAERQCRALGVGEVGASRHAAMAKIRSSVSPAFLRERPCMSTQTLQPLIWLARIHTSSKGSERSPAFITHLRALAVPASRRERGAPCGRSVVASLLLLLARSV